MKAILVISLIALTLCSYSEISIKEEEIGPGILESKDVFEILRCLIKQTIQITPDISELIDAIKIQDYLRAVTIAVKIYQEGKVIYPKCFATLIEFLRIDGQCLAQCLENIEGGFDICRSFVDALGNQKWIESITLATECAAKFPNLKSQCQCHTK